MGNETDNSSVTCVKAHRYSRERGWIAVDEEVTGESPLTVYVNGNEFATVVCSPWKIEHMAVGFLCSEGILRTRDALGDLVIDRDRGIVQAQVDGFEESAASKVFLKRYINSCCGRSRASFYYSTDALLCKRVRGDVRITPEQALWLMERVMTGSDVFKRTGGVHAGLVATLLEHTTPDDSTSDASDDAAGAAAASSPDVRIPPAGPALSAPPSDHAPSILSPTPDAPAGVRVLSFHEDIGRNNVLDRMYGQCFLEGIGFADKAIAFSGRVSSEIALKMSKMGAPILVSHAAPSSLGLELADDLGITVIAFTRDDRLTVYTHPERVADSG